MYVQVHSHCGCLGTHGVFGKYLKAIQFHCNGPAGTLQNTPSKLGFTIASEISFWLAETYHLPM